MEKDREKACSLAATMHYESFLAFHARVVPLVVLIAVFIEGVAWLVSPPYEGSFKVFNPYGDLLWVGFLYFAYLLAWLVGRIHKAMGGRPKRSFDLSFRVLNLWAISVALAAGVMFAFVMSHFEALVWSIWATGLGVGAVVYSIFVLDWLSHRVYRVVARKLLPAH